jgi:hypothetical protein
MYLYLVCRVALVRLHFLPKTMYKILVILVLIDTKNVCWSLVIVTRRFRPGVFQFSTTLYRYVSIHDIACVLICAIS